MKKRLAIAMSIMSAITMSACSLPDESSIVSDTTVETEAMNEQVSRELLELLENRVETTQPGTAGSGLKAVYAAKNIVEWVKENQPQAAVINATVKEFFENYEFSDESQWAFDMICSVFDAFSSGNADALLENTGINIKDFETTQETSECIDKLIEEIKGYISQK